MKRIFLIFFLLLLCRVETMAQGLQSANHQASTPPSDARFEVIQSGLAAKWTFKLNRVTGDVYQLAMDKKENLVWEKIYVLPHPKGAPITSDKPRFQIFSSGLAAKYTFLLDTQTGATWQIVSSEKGNVWSPVD